MSTVANLRIPARLGALLLAPAAALALLLSLLTVSAVAAPLATTLAGSSMVVTNAPLVVGGSVTVSYSTDAPSPTNWIAIYPMSSPDPCSGCGYAWKYAPGSSGSVTVPLDDRNGADLPAGQYRLEYLANDGWGRTSNPVAITIGSAGGTVIAASDTDIVADEPFSITWTTDQPHDKNWIGIYPPSAGSPDGSPASTLWQYTPGASGSASFSGLPAGTWVAYFLARDGYTQLGQPLLLTVAADPNAPQPGDPNTPVEIDPVQTTTETDGVFHREGFTVGTAPEGWSVSFDADSAGNDAFRGWRFTDRATWRATIDEMRGRFARSHQGFAVADGQQYGDAEFASTLTSEPIPVEKLAVGRLTFDSHYRGAAGQAGTVRVAFDGGEPAAILRLDESNVANGYDGAQMNASQDVLFEVPRGAKEAVFSWELTGGADSRYWAIDSVQVHHVLAETDAAPTEAWVVSDIQGHPADWQHGIGDLSRIAPEADGMLMVGDIVASGSVAEWDQIYAVMDATADVRPPKTIAALGNHERYVGWATGRDRFLQFAGRDRIWDEYVMEGPGGKVPVIVLGQEFAGPTDVPMSEQQVRFLEQRLAHWTPLGKQVLVISHFPLADTVSGSWVPYYRGHYQHQDRLQKILSNYPNAIFLSGHTHYSAALGDWAVQRRIEGGHPDGFWAVNTVAMHVGWDAAGETLGSTTEHTTTNVNVGLTMKAYGDRVEFTAHDFFTDTELRTVTIPNPLTPFDAVPGFERVVVESRGAGVASADLDLALPGETVTLVAEPEAGHRLAGWDVTPESVEIAEDGTFTMPAEEVRVTARFVEHEIAAVTGVVNSSAGGPVGQACVYLYEAPETPSARYASCAREDGGFRIGGVAPGDYTVAVADPTGGHATWWSLAPVSVTPGMADLAITLDAVGTVSGIVSGTGGPAAGACVYLYAAADAASASYATCTGADGAYWLGGIAAGDYVLAVADPTGAHQTRWQDVTIAGRTTVDVTLAAAKGGVSGLVTEAGAAPVGGACVYLYPADVTTAAAFASCAQADGTYLVREVDAADYDVAFFDPSARYATQWWTGAAGGAATQAGAVPVGVGASVVENVDAALSEVG